MSDPYPSPELYDVLYSGRRDDVDFYVAEARAASGPVLEVGCGSGRVLLPTRAAGVDIDGLDLREEMLEALRRKAEAQGLTVQVTQGDMRDFTMPRRYALITLPFRVFQHNLTTEDQIHTLRTCREHLEHDGALVFNAFYPSFARLAAPDGERVLEEEFPHPATGAPLRLYSVRTSNRVRQVMDVRCELQELGNGGAVVRTHPYAFSLRWTFAPEMELLLGAAGFQRFEVFGGFDRRALLTDTDEMVWYAWRD